MVVCSMQVTDASQSGSARRCLPAPHRVEELGIALCGLDLVEQKFHCFHVVHRIEQLAQHPDLLQHVRLDAAILRLRVPERLTLIAG